MPDDLTKLKAILPPPTEPVDATGDWHQAEQALGTTLPADYKAFIESYGVGNICDLIEVFNPLSNINNLVAWVEGHTEYRLSSDRKNDLEIYTLPPFPEPGGILIWGYSNLGDEFFWITDGPPDTWGTLVHDRGRIESYTYPKLSCVDFLTELLSDNLPKTPWSPDTLMPPRFEPFVEKPDPPKWEYRAVECDDGSTKYILDGFVSFQLPPEWSLEPCEKEYSCLFEATYEELPDQKQTGWPVSAELSQKRCQEPFPFADTVPIRQTGPTRNGCACSSARSSRREAPASDSRLQATDLAGKGCQERMALS